MNLGIFAEKAGKEYFHISHGTWSSKDLVLETSNDLLEGKESLRRKVIQRKRA